MSNVKPIFLISLPRSGSTFLQKVLMSHPMIASASEQWFLLPLLHMRNKEGVVARYGHVQSVNALRRVDQKFGESFFDGLLSELSNSIYQRYCESGETYFLDKTPRYYFILQKLEKVFPDAKFVLLLRNPVSVFASSIQAFLGGELKRLDHLNHDFYSGPELIAKFAGGQRENVLVVNYESLVSDTPGTVERICDFLDISFSQNIIDDSFSFDIEGHGDHLGAKTFKRVMKNTENWKSIITTHCRKRRLLRYLESYSDEYLDLGGYSKMNLIEGVKSHRTARVGLKEYMLWLLEILIRTYKRPFKARGV